jgi:hypothetical protein
VAGCCECGDEPSGSCAAELVSYSVQPDTFPFGHRHVVMFCLVRQSTEMKKIPRKTERIVKNFMLN